VKFWPALFAATVLCCGISACAAEKRDVGAVGVASTAEGSFKGDGDGDNPKDLDDDEEVDNDIDDDTKTRESQNYHDKDDNTFLGFGSAAGGSLALKLKTFVGRYYASSRAGNGVAACAMILPAIARSVPEDYGSGAGPTYLRGGKTCPAVLSRLFAYLRDELAGAINVTSARVDRNMALLMIGSLTAPAGYVTLERQRGAWYVVGLLGEALP
jgi:hypothetical protein